MSPGTPHDDPAQADELLDAMWPKRRSPLHPTQASALANIHRLRQRTPTYPSVQAHLQDSEEGEPTWTTRPPPAESKVRPSMPFVISEGSRREP